MKNFISSIAYILIVIILFAKGIPKKEDNNGEMSKIITPENLAIIKNQMDSISSLTLALKKSYETYAFVFDEVIKDSCNIIDKKAFEQFNCLLENPLIKQTNEVVCMDKEIQECDSLLNNSQKIVHVQISSK